MRDYLEEVGYDLESYVNELLRNIKDDLFDIVGIEEENIDATTKQIIEALYQTLDGKDSTTEG